jgi:secreted trypsin-like serine protease
MVRYLGWLWALGVGVSVSLAAGCASPTDASSDAAEGAGEDELVEGNFTFERPEIGRIDLDSGTFCTATLISSRTVLSAAHCVDWSTVDTPGESHGDFTIELSADDKRTFAIDGYVSYGQKGKGGDDDIALLRLTDPVPPSVAKPAAIATRKAKSGERVTIFGYGCTDRGGWDGERPPEDTHSGKKQKRSFTSKPVRWICPGDSGGPTILGKDGPVYRVSSWYYYFDLFGIGRPDTFGDVVKNRARILEQIKTWGS